ncbi:MAG: ATP-binding cassette domain-containing protein [Leptospirales bacterium]|jgi:molybdate transport system ATP-binding protein
MSDSEATKSRAGDADAARKRNSGENSFEARELQARIDFPRGDEFALRLSFQTKGPAPILGVYGASGAGKTTLLHLWAGLLTPRSGTLRHGSRVLFARGDERSEARATIRGPEAFPINLSPAARRVGYVFQEARIFPHLSAGQNVLYGTPARGSGGPAPPQFSPERLKAVLGLNEVWNRPGNQLSGGQQKRVAIARALASRPELLLCDEAGGNLDAESRAAFMELMRDLPAGTRAIYVSHDLAELSRLTDEILVLDRGGLLYHGAPADLSGATDALDLFARAGGAPPLVLRRDQMRTSVASSEIRISDPYLSAPDHTVFVIDAAHIHLAAKAPEALTGFPDRWPGRLLDFVEVAGAPCVRVSFFDQGPECVVPLGEPGEQASAWRIGDALLGFIHPGALL